MERPGVYTGSGRHPDHDVNMLPPAIMGLGQVVDDLVEAAGDKVGELHLDDRLHAIDGQSLGGTDDG